MTDNRPTIHERIRVLFVISDLSGGGAERAVSTTLQHMDRDRFELGLCMWRDIRRYLVPPDVAIWILGKDRPWHTIRAVRRTARLLRRWGPRAIVSHLPWVNLTVGMAVRLAAWRGPWFPVFQTVADKEFPAWFMPVYREVLRPARTLLGVSRDVSETCRRALHIPGSRVRTLHNPVDFGVVDDELGAGGRPQPQRAAPVLITMGRLVPAKDHATLIRALALARRHVKARLVILGEGPLRGALQDLASRVGVREAVELPGFNPHPFAAVAGADAFVLSSRQEGLPTALIEAMATGVPCISTRCPGVQEIAENGRSALLVPVGDAGALAGAIVKVLQHRRLAAMLGRNGRRRVRVLFSADENVRKLGELLVAAIGGPRSRRPAAPRGRKRTSRGRARRRVLFVISSLGGGGAEKSVVTFLRHLDRSRFEPGLCLWDDLCAYPVPHDVPVWAVNPRRELHTPGVICAMARLMRRWRPDVVTSHMGFVNMATGLAIRLARWRGAWLPFFRAMPESEFCVRVGCIYRRIIASADRVVAISNGLRDHCRELLRLPADKVVTQYNPVDFEPVDRSLAGRGRQRRGQRLVATMGRLVEVKDHAMLLRAMAQVRRRVDAELVILGEGALRGRLRTLARELGIADRLRLPGFSADPFAALSEADVFALSSRTEGLGRALIEAMACGLPCVSTRCPYGPGEIVQDGESGLLVDVGDADGMAAALLRVLEDPAFARRLGEAGSRRVRSMFSPGVQVAKFEQLVEELLGADA